MNIKFLLCVGFAAVLAAGCRSGSPNHVTPSDNFTYQGQPVNPRAVEDLSEWISDDHPGPVAVDLAGTVDSNRYYGDIWQRNGMVGFDREEPDSVFGMGMFAYRYCGRLANGCYVLKTLFNGGGSGDFESILLVKFTTNAYFDNGGHTRERLLLEQAGEYPLGDRVEAQVRIHENTVEWTTKDKDHDQIEF